ncbi:unnamed protein product [Closterium sp. NIES-65]|nr:unnamed protein product [Closterium sp. NIES-65]
MRVHLALTTLQFRVSFSLSTYLPCSHSWYPIPRSASGVRLPQHDGPPGVRLPLHGGRAELGPHVRGACSFVPLPKSFIPFLGYTISRSFPDNQLLEFAYRYMTDVLGEARVYAEHAGHAALEVDDVRLAVQAKVSTSFSQPPPRELSQFKTPSEVDDVRLAVQANVSSSSFSQLALREIESIFLVVHLASPFTHVIFHLCHYVFMELAYARSAMPMHLSELPCTASVFTLFAPLFHPYFSPLKFSRNWPVHAMLKRLALYLLSLTLFLALPIAFRPSQVLMELARARNAVPIPPIAGSGLFALPPEAECLLQPNVQIAVPLPGPAARAAALGSHKRQRDGDTGGKAGGRGGGGKGGEAAARVKKEQGGAELQDGKAGVGGAKTVVAARNPNALTPCPSPQPTPGSTTSSSSSNSAPHSSHPSRVSHTLQPTAPLPAKALTFEFNHVFGYDSSNFEVYTEFCKGAVERAVAGCRAVVLLYGQTGTGKTHTISGSDVEAGVFHHAMADVFRAAQSDDVSHLRARFQSADVNASERETVGTLEQSTSVVQRQPAPDTSAAVGNTTSTLSGDGGSPAANQSPPLLCFLSVVEIYNERAVDLLQGVKPSSVQVKENGSSRSDSSKSTSGSSLLHAAGRKLITEQQLHSVEEAAVAFELAGQRRKVRGTNRNKQSSRSHMLYVFRIRRTLPVSGAEGKEIVVEGNEGQYNEGLYSEGMLGSGGSSGGFCAVLFCINPQDVHVSKTTLRYSAMTRRIRMDYRPSILSLSAPKHAPPVVHKPAKRRPAKACASEVHPHSPTPAKRGNGQKGVRTGVKRVSGVEGKRVNAEEGVGGEGKRGGTEEGKEEQGEKVEEEECGLNVGAAAVACEGEAAGEAVLEWYNGYGDYSDKENANSDYAVTTQAHVEQMGLGVCAAATGAAAAAAAFDPSYFGASSSSGSKSILGSGYGYGSIDDCSISSPESNDLSPDSGSGNVSPNPSSPNATSPKCCSPNSCSPNSSCSEPLTPTAPVVTPTHTSTTTSTFSFLSASSTSSCAASTPLSTSTARSTISIPISPLGHQSPAAFHQTLHACTPPTILPRLLSPNLPCMFLKRRAPSTAAVDTPNACAATAALAESSGAAAELGCDSSHPLSHQANPWRCAALVCTAMQCIALDVQSRGDGEEEGDADEGEGVFGEAGICLKQVEKGEGWRKMDPKGHRVIAGEDGAAENAKGNLGNRKKLKERAVVLQRWLAMAYVCFSSQDGVGAVL